MLDQNTRLVLQRRPKIEYIVPRSTDVIPETSVAPAEDKRDRLTTVLQSLENIENTALLLERQVAQRAKDVEVELDLTNPEDFTTAQAAARIFPDRAVEIQPGLKIVKKITFDMYSSCVQHMKDHGKERGKSNQIFATDPVDRSKFGGQEMDRRPELNRMSVPFVPIDLGAYTAAVVPLVFSLLYPLVSLYVNTKILGHTHNTLSVGSPTGPGVAVNAL